MAGYISCMLPGYFDYLGGDMKKVNEKPSSGAFVAVWEYDSGIFSNAFRWNDEGFLEIYNTFSDEWEEKLDRDGEDKRTYFVAD